MVVHLDVPSLTAAELWELWERVEQFGQEIIPTVKSFAAAGEWKRF